MTDTQLNALQEMYNRNIGAIAVKGYGWVFPQHIRDNAKLAGCVLAKLQSGSFLPKR